MIVLQKRCRNNEFNVINDDYLQNMKDKQTSMGGFAAYARNMNSYKANIHNYHRTVDYIKSLFEVCLTLFVVVCLP